MALASLQPRCLGIPVSSSGRWHRTCPRPEPYPDEMLEFRHTMPGIIGRGTLTGVEQVAVKLVAGQHYGCEHCLAACIAVGASRGLTAE